MKESTDKRIPREPVVVVMGHIDHGKSTLLDYIRKSNTTDGEAGGITQHVASYEASGITFIDTPGHEAFTAIRERGSIVADIAILVVSAEDGVKPQTVEAVSWIKKSKIPFLVAINKIDKPNANPEKAKTELAEQEVFVEGWGGTVPFVLVSAKTGQGVPDLLETIKLQAEIDGLSYDPSAPASGFIVESKRDAKRGISATLIIKEGTLKKGDFVRAGAAIAPVRSLEDSSGKKIEKSVAGKSVVLNNWSLVPQVGFAFSSYKSKQEAEKAAENPDQIMTNTEESSSPKASKLVPVIIKADTVGSLEAIVHELKKLETDKIGLKIISYGVGGVSEVDAKMAKAFPELLMLAFNVKTDPRAKDMAERDGITIKNFDIIYKLTEWVGEKLTELVPKEEVDEISGTATVIRIFSVNKSKQVLGGRVDEGTLEVNSLLKIWRRDALIGEGHVKELQSKKVKTSKVEAGIEFGAMVDSRIEIAVGDKLSCIKRIFK